MIFNCERTSIRNDDGTYAAAGVWWTEARWLAEHVMFACGVALFVTGFLLIIVSGPVWCLAAGVGAAMLLQAYELPGRKRKIMFRANGRMETPWGLSTDSLAPGERWLDHTEIESIEIEQLSFPKDRAPYAYTHGVRIFYAGGEMNHIAKNLTADDAHMLAVRLNQARRTMKDQIQRPYLSGGIRRVRQMVD